MTKAEIVNLIAKQTKVEQSEVMEIVEAFMKVIKNSLTDGENVYLREFGTFLIKHRAEKPARIISKNKTIIVPAHNIPSFKPSNIFSDKVKLASDDD
jgi:DNA-binding protein HU-beta